MENIRRIRIATKGPGGDAAEDPHRPRVARRGDEVVDLGRKLHKEVVLHTHFNHPNEITGITRDAMNRLFERGITVRNQSVLHPQRQR
jgi:lysine 2,3-aminomutase